MSFKTIRDNFRDNLIKDSSKVVDDGADKFYPLMAIGSILVVFCVYFLDPTTIALVKYFKLGQMTNVTIKVKGEGVNILKSYVIEPVRDTNGLFTFEHINMVSAIGSPYVLKYKNCDKCKPIEFTISKDDIQSIQLK